MVRFSKIFPPSPETGYVYGMHGIMKEPWGKKGAAGGQVIATDGEVSIHVTRDGEEVYDTASTLWTGGTAIAGALLPSRPPTIGETIMKVFAKWFGIENGSTTTEIDSLLYGTKKPAGIIWMSPVQTKGVEGPYFGVMYYD
jgi:hypothetical protein